MVSLKKKEKSFRRKPKHIELTLLQKQLIVGIVITITLGVLTAFVWYVSHVQSLQIQSVEIVGGQTIPHEVIKDAVESELSGSYFKIVPKRFLPMYPKQHIYDRVESINRVKHVQVERSGGTLTVVFDEYVPYALWCAAPETETCLFIDATGYAFAQAPELQGSAFVRYVDEGVVPQQDVKGFDREFITQSEQFIDELENGLSLYVTHVLRHGSYDVDYTIAGGGVIKISQSIPMQESFENLQTLLLSDAFKHIEPGSFQYIDLRFGEKVFINEDISGETSSSSETTSNPE